MPGGGPTLTIHRSAHEIGGNCIELAFDGHRILLDVGSPLDATDGGQLPETLDRSAHVDAVVLSHAHHDHVGLLGDLPTTWPIWSGAPTRDLTCLSAAVGGRRLDAPWTTWRSFEPFTAGPFTVTPLLTDHSAFDAHMVLVEVGGRRILYSGDFRTNGRKGVLVERLMRDPPDDVDVLLLEGTTLGRTGVPPTEAALEASFARVFEATPGRVFVTWSAQNIDRTVTLYKAARRSGRALVLDLYALDVMRRLTRYNDSLPRLGWAGIEAVVTSKMKWLYEQPDRLNEPGWVEEVARSRCAMGAARLAARDDVVVMLRPSLLRDFVPRGLAPRSHDAWIFSMWSGYTGTATYADMRAAFASVGVSPTQIHTSGHATRDALRAFARSIGARHLVPIHGDVWDDHVDAFDNVRRLDDGAPFVIP